MNQATKTFREALRWMDEKQPARAEELLRRTLEQADAERDELALGGALCCLADLWVEQRRYSEALPLYQRLSKLQRHDGALAHEVGHARDALRRLQEALVPAG